MEQESEGLEKQKKRLGRIQRTAIVGFVILIVVLVYALVKNHSVYTSYEVVNTMSRGDNTSVYYQMTSKGMVRYSKDGIAMTDRNGNVLWNQTYEMGAPILAASGEYVAIGDMGSNNIYVFYEYGQIGRIVTDVPIQTITMSDQGVTAAILSDTSSNYVNLYDRQGQALGSIKASLENTGYPLAIGLSSDASRLVVSYLSMDSGSVQTRVIFYDFSQVDGEHVIESVQLEGIYPKVAFLSDSRVALYGESSFCLYNIGSSISEVQSETFEDTICSVFEGDQKMGFIFNNEDDNGKYRMEIYDMAGKRNTRVYFDHEYDAMTADDDEIILYNDQAIWIYQYSGRLRFECQLESAITGVMASWEDGMYWLIDDQSLQEIRIE